MEDDIVEKKKFKKRLLNKKVILIILIAFVIVGTGGTAAIVKASDNPQFCTLCHNMQPMYDSYHDSNLLANSHAKAGVKCHDCHESSLSIQAEEGMKYITGNYESPMKTREFPQEMCLKCHNYDDVKAKTNFDESNPHDSHNGELQCYTCHKMHEPSQVLCTQCHNFSWMNNLPGYFQTK
ncbi:cytochrome c3 family protein [Desulfitobacterium sp. Sab5]|uniref:cytochrome c3 family protein n=1 Tax=Desulfitobacterium nosdiversum TaxID=3375356 RepID=UPI003CF58728